jgi:hypothetical protein
VNDPVAGLPVSRREPIDVATMEEPFEKSSVAQLLCDQIDRMDRRKLIAVIRAAKMPLIRADIDSGLEFCDRDTLQRLAYLGRRSCRNQGY